ncbi:hypothetical protein FNX48_023490, partial [Streptomyces sp. IF17]|nr:hypothetical protein [Streptomyces alkaliphilus]
MNDRHDPYREFRGYDEYGRPVWETAPRQGEWDAHGGGEPAGAGSGGWDPYGTDPASGGTADPGYDGGYGGTAHGYGTAEWAGN